MYWSYQVDWFPPVDRFASDWESTGDNVSKENSVARKSRSDEAVESIEAMIAENGWGSGFQLPSQRTLADELPFSRPTIREALVALEARGRIEIRPGKGVFLAGGESGGATPSSGAKVQVPRELSGRVSQMYQFRYAVEPAIAGLVAVNGTNAQIADMNAVVEAMRKAMARQDFAAFFELDFSFHSLMIEAANNRFFTEAISPFMELFFESQKLPLAFDEGVVETVCEHEELMRHIQAGDAAEAHRAMERHIQGVAKRARVKLVE
jgi:GntR family transcriptional repressor for pyruvate dehydrogenase complex